MRKPDTKQVLTQPSGHKPRGYKPVAVRLKFEDGVIQLLQAFESCAQSLTLHPYAI